MGHSSRLGTCAILTIAFVCVNLVLILAVPEASGQDEQNQTLIAKGSGTDVVEATAEKIHMSGIFPDDRGFLRRIAYVESKDGTDPNTYRDGYYGGIWQVDEIGFEDTQDTMSHPGLVNKFAKIKAEFGIDWSSVQWKGLEKPFYSGLAARLFLSNIPEAIPCELDEQARYWKKYYNTEAGKGTVQRFIDEVNELEAQ